MTPVQQFILDLSAYLDALAKDPPYGRPSRSADCFTINLDTLQVHQHSYFGDRPTLTVSLSPYSGDEDEDAEYESSSDFAFDATDSAAARFLSCWHAKHDAAFYDRLRTCFLLPDAPVPEKLASLLSLVPQGDA